MMLRRIVCAVAVLALTLGVASAEQLRGKITKLDGSKVTFQEMKKGENVGDAKTYDLDSNVKVSKRTGKDTSEPVSGGLKADALKNIDAAKGVQATIDVSGGKVTEIILGGGKKKKNQ